MLGGLGALVWWVDRVADDGDGRRRRRTHNIMAGRQRYGGKRGNEMKDMAGTARYGGKRKDMAGNNQKIQTQTHNPPS
jgi:hypothetical protein